MLLLSLTVACQTETLTRRYIVEIQQDATFSKQSFSVKPNQHVLSYDTSDIADKNGFITPNLLSDYKRRCFFGYEVKKNLIESISWQLLYATNLLVAFELIMTSKAHPPGATSYSWPPVERIVTVGWLLKSYWNPDSPMFKPIEQSEMRLTQGNQPFAITTMIHGSGYVQQPQSQLPESSGQQAPQTTHQPTNAFTNPLSSGSGDGFEDPQQHVHTLGIDCFVHPCRGVCNFRPSSESIGSTERVLKSEESLASLTAATPEQNPCPHDCLCYCCIRHSASAYETSNNLFTIQLQCASGQLFQGYDMDDNPANTTPPPEPVPCNLKTLDEDGQLRNCEKVYKSVQSLFDHQRKVHSGKKTCLAPVVGEDGRLRPCGEVWKNAVALSNHRRSAHTGQQTCNVIIVTEDGRERPCGRVCKNASALSSHRGRTHTGQQTCQITMVTEDGQERLCGKVCMNAFALWSHRTSVHSGPRTCNVTVVGEAGQLRPCGKVCKNASAFSDHKRYAHTGQQTCDVIVVGEGGQQRPCGTVCKNAKTLSSHKVGCHSGQKTCEVIVLGKDDKPQPCGKVCMNSGALSSHKKSAHTGQRTCDVTVVGEDGQLRPCGKLCNNAGSLSSHKFKQHTGKKTCQVTMVAEDGQPRPCGTVCKNVSALRYHKISTHTGQQTCDVTVLGENGQLRPCGKVYQNAMALSAHKRTHRKRKPVDANRKDGLSPPQGNVNK